MPNVIYRPRVVKRGDTLSAIAEELMGSASKWQELYAANKDTIGADPDKIKAGMQLRLPGSEPTAPEAGQPEVRAPQTDPLLTVKEPAPVLSLKQNTSFLDKKVPVVEPYEAGSAFVEGMMRRGWTPQEAAGTAGNVHVESGFQPGIKSSVPNENSYGFLQWNKERLAGLKMMAEQTQRDWTDPEVQMDYIHAERTGDSVKYGGSDERAMYRRAFEGGGTPEEIAERFGRFVERPRRLADSLATRQAAAAKYGYIDDITDRIFGG